MCDSDADMVLCSMSIYGLAGNACIVIAPQYSTALHRNMYGL